MAETPQPVDAGQSAASTTGQERGVASAPPPPPTPGYGWGGYWPPPPAGRGPLLKPGFAPGPVFIGLTAGVMGLGIVASSGAETGLSLLAGSVGLTIGFVWMVAFIIGSQDTRLIFSRRAWARWTLPPAIFFISVALMMSGVPADARFELSKPAFDQAAVNARAGTSYGPGWIGLINVEDVRLDGDATFFDVSEPDSGYSCVYANFPSQTDAVNSWLRNTYKLHGYGGGWWYGCAGPSD